MVLSLLFLHLKIYRTAYSRPGYCYKRFVYVREAEELLDEARAIVSDSVEKCLDKNITDWSKIKNIIKDDLSEYLWKKIKRNPVILPIIMEAQI